MREYVHSADHSSVITSLEVELSAQPRTHAPCVQYGEEGQRCSYSISRTAADESSQHQQTLPHASPDSSPSRYLSFIWHCLSADSAGAASAPTLWGRPTKPEGITASFSSLFSHAFNVIWCIFIEWSRRSEGQNARSYMKKRSCDRETH